MGFRTVLIEDCSRGIRDDNIQATFQKVRDSNGCVVHSNEVINWTHKYWDNASLQVKAMVQGRDRRPELGYKLAVECRTTLTYPAKNKNSRYNNLPANTESTDPADVNQSNHNTAKVTCNIPPHQMLGKVKSNMIFKSLIQQIGIHSAKYFLFQ